jgi:hypothetical protein
MTCNCETCRYERNLPYKPGTPLRAIIEDGFYRGFDMSQTLQEATKMGYELKPSELLRAWDKLEADMFQYFQECAEMDKEEKIDIATLDILKGFE